MILYLLIIVDILGMALAQLSLKKGISLLGPIDFSLVSLWQIFLAIFKNVFLLGGLVLAGLSLLLWLVIISRINLSIIYPISASLTISTVALGAYILFKENISWVQVAGIVAIIFGIFLIYYKNNF